MMWKWANESKSGIVSVEEDGSVTYLNSGSFYDNIVASGAVTDVSEPIALTSSNEVIREHRNKLLTASDWTQVADAPVDQTAWAAYRQALRDVPAQTGFPTDVVWPVKP